MKDSAFLIFRYGFFIYSVVFLFSLFCNRTLTVLLLLSLMIAVTLWYISLERRERSTKNQKCNHCKENNNHDEIKGAGKR